MTATDVAKTKPSRSATAANLDAVYAQLAGLQLRRAVAEGSVFPSTHWARCEGGWRLRDAANSPVGAAA